MLLHFSATPKCTVQVYKNVLAAMEEKLFNQALGLHKTALHSSL